MTFDELIAQGIRDTLAEKCAEYRLDGKKHHFSLAYKIARQSTIISCRKRKPLSIRRIKYILLAILLTLFALLGFGLWQTIGRYSFNDLNDHSRVYFNGSNIKAEIEEIYGLPEEYELLDIFSNKFTVSSKYMVDGEEVILCQDLASAMGNTNTENNEVEYLTINGSDGYYIKMFDERSYIAWVMDGYHFYLFGKIDKETAVFLAESLKIKNFDKIP